MNGADSAEANVMAAYAADIASLDHENSSASGFRKTGNVKKNDDTRNTPTPAAPTTRQPS